MKPEAEQLLQKAARAVRAAETLLAHGDEDFSLARAYYAMFYAAEALLLNRELKFSKHSGVHAAFGEQFAKTGLIDAHYHRWLLDAFDKRTQGDYGIDATLTRDDALEAIERASQFVDMARAFLGR